MVVRRKSLAIGDGVGSDGRMLTGDLITRLSVWLALGTGTLGIALRAEARGRLAWWNGARWAWTAGCVCFLVHVAAAFSAFHHWSHQSAYEEVARQTAALAGRHWGGGIYFNYAFAAAWLGDVLWWWGWPATWRHRPAWLSATWHGFFFFMVLNGAVIFVRGPMRWLGLFLCGIMMVSWGKSARHGIPDFQAPQPS